MGSIARLAVSAGVFALAGVGCTPPQLPPCQVSGVPLPAFAQVGENAPIDVGLVAVCNILPADPKFFTADEAVVEVFDPNGDTFPFTAEKPVRQVVDNSITNSVRVAFTPNRVGLWRITARLEPAIGATTLLVPAVEVVGNPVARSVSAAELPGDCVRYAQTASGTVLCTPAESKTVATHRGQRFSASAVSVMGNTVWIKQVDGSGLLERWVDDGGTLIKTNETAVEMAQAPALMVAAPDESLWLLSSASFSSPLPSRVHHIFPEADGGLRVTDVASSSLSAPRQVAAGNDTVQVCAAAVHGEYGSADGGRFTSIPSAIRAAMGGDETTLWAFEGLNLEAFHPTPNGLQQATVTLPVAAVRLVAEAAVQLTPVLPMVTNPGANWGAVPKLVDGQIGLEGYRTSAGFTMVGATKRHVYARSDDGKQLQVIER